LRPSPPNPRSILFLITGLGCGGAETQLLLLTRELVARGWTPKIVSMISGGSLRTAFENLGVGVRSLGMPRGIPDPRGLVQLARILRQERPAILHTHMVHSNLLGRVTTMFAGVPVVISTAHSVTEGGRWREVAYRMTDSLADLTTIISQAAAARFIRVGAAPERKLRMVRNGIQLEAFGSSAENRARLRAELGIGDRFVWLAVGRLDTPKDYPNLFNATALLKDEHRVLLIAGAGPLRQPMERLVAKLGISETVRFLGHRQDIPALMTAADAFVMSSAWEGLPMVLLEASSSCLPIVTTAVGGNSEVVLDEISGYLVPAENPVALAKAMTRMEHLSCEARYAMGQAGRDHVARHYSIGSVVDEWEEVYHSLLLRKLDQEQYAQPFFRS
jgi:glycosyltransferase involved in cell wall biosynthesis